MIFFRLFLGNATEKKESTPKPRYPNKNVACGVLDSFEEHKILNATEIPNYANQCGFFSNSSTDIKGHKINFKYEKRRF